MGVPHDLGKLYVLDPFWNEWLLGRAQYWDHRRFRKRTGELGETQRTPVVKWGDSHNLWVSG